MKPATAPMRDIDADQCRIDAEIGDDGGGDQRHRRAAQRREGLLHRHRAEREVEIEDGAAPGRLRHLHMRHTPRQTQACDAGARSKLEHAVARSSRHRGRQEHRIVTGAEALSRLLGDNPST